MDDFDDLLAALEWGATLSLTDELREIEDGNLS